MKVLKRIWWQLYPRLIQDGSKTEKNTILIAGEGRSGTTWLAQQINTSGRFRQVFEPFNRLYNLSENDSKKSLFPPHLYLNGNEVFSKRYKAAKSIFTGKRRNVIIDCQNSKFLYQGRIVKEIIASMHLEWFHARFPNLPIIYIYRHPFAVAFSRVKRQWGRFQEEAIYQPELQPFLKDKLSVIEDLNLKHPFINQLFTVCLNHYIVRKTCLGSDILFLHYERVKKDPLRYLRIIEEFLSMDLKLQDMNVKSGGAGYMHGKALDSGELVLELENTYGKELMEEAAEILSIFDLEKVYNRKCEIVGDYHS